MVTPSTERDGQAERGRRAADDPHCPPPWVTWQQQRRPDPGPGRLRAPRVHRPDVSLDEPRTVPLLDDGPRRPPARGTAGHPRAAARRFKSRGPAPARRRHRRGGETARLASRPRPVPLFASASAACSATSVRSAGSPRPESEPGSLPRSTSCLTRRSRSRSRIAGIAETHFSGHDVALVFSGAPTPLAGAGIVASLVQWRDTHAADPPTTPETSSPTGQARPSGG